MTLLSPVAFYCRHCNLFVPIALPPPILAQIESCQAGLAPMGKIDPELFVACPKCAVVYPCRLPDLRSLFREMPDLHLNPPDIRLIRAQRVCGRENCGTPVTIHTIVPNGTTREELLQIASKWDFRALACPGCHAFLRESLVGAPVFPELELPN